MFLFVSRVVGELHVHAVLDQHVSQFEEGHLVHASLLDEFRQRLKVLLKHLLGVVAHALHLLVHVAAHHHLLHLHHLDISITLKNVGGHCLDHL